MDFLPSPRGTRKAQAQTEWNSSGSYSRYPILLSLRTKKARPRWVAPLSLALVSGCAGLALGVMSLRAVLPRLAPAPPPVAAAPAPVVAAPVVAAPAPAPAEPAAPVRSKRSRQADKALELGWDAYGHGRYDRSKDLALQALEAVGAEHGTAAQRAQAKGLLEQSIASMTQPDLVPLVVKAPEPAQVQEPVPAVVEEPVVRPEPQVRPAPVPRVAPQPGPLPQTSYPQASGRRSAWRMPVPRNVPGPVQVSLPPVVQFPGITQALPPGMLYPPGRGPNECPNYQAVDDCACHQYEGAVRGFSGASSTFEPRGFTRSRPVSRMEAWRRSESLLGRGSI